MSFLKFGNHIVHDFDNDGDMDVFGTLGGGADVYYIEANTIIELN